MAALSLTVLYPSAGHSAEAPATRPGSPTTRSFQESLKLTEKEQRALSAVRDRSTQLDETAFYMLLRKAHRISEIGEQKLRALDRPAVGNLLRHPERYRGWAIRIPLRVHRVEKLTVGDGLTPSLYWPADRPVWKMSCIDARSDDPLTGPVLVFSAVEPTALGEPDAVGDQGERVYHPGRTVKLAGIAYKVWRSKDLDGNVRDFPVVMGWRTDAPSPKQTKTKPGLSFSGYHAAALVAILLMVYLMLRRYTERRRRDASRVSYRSPPEQLAPKRGEPPDTDEEAQREQPPEVDPLLRDAAEQYRKEKGDEDGPDEDRPG